MSDLSRDKIKHKKEKEVKRWTLDMQKKIDIIYLIHMHSILGHTDRCL